MALEEYRRKRDFTQTPEPSGDPAPSPEPDSGWHQLPEGRRYCVQMHRATRMHYDVRLEHNGVLLSWAVPRGPSLDPGMKRLAVQTEDHPVDYGDFEGIIPSGYGMGTVELWDIGSFEWVRESAEDPDRQLAKGDIKFRLKGRKLSGEFALVRIGERGRSYGGSTDGDRNFLMIKKKDDAVIEGYEAAEHDLSVKTGRTLAEIASQGGGDPREQRRQARVAAREGSSGPRPRQSRDASDEERPSATSGLPAAGELPQPMLAISVDRPFSRPGWLFELKYDGVRAIIAVAGGKVRLVGRRGRDETDRYPEAAGIPAQVKAGSAILDAEIVVLDERGRADFERLQSRINIERPGDVRRAMERSRVSFMVFDLLAIDGRNLLDTDLRIRKKTLRETVTGEGPMLFADHVDAEGESFFAAVQEQGLEGVVAKRGDSRYQPGRRSPDWLKIKAWQSQSCVIAGWTQGHGRRGHLGALVLGVGNGTELVHCGQVGSGLSEPIIQDLLHRLEPLKRTDPPFAIAPSLAVAATWVAPELVCDVRHAGWSRIGVLRHPSYRGLRPDLTPNDCVREEATETALAVPAAEHQHQASAEMPAGPAEPDAAPHGESVAVLRVVPAKHGDPAPVDSGEPGSQDPSISEALEQLRGLRANGTWEVAGRRLKLTNLDKVLWPEDGITKRDMVAYYVAMAPYLLPYLRERPLSMQVFPDGITGKSFWRKDKPEHAPAWIQSWLFRGEGGSKNWIVPDETAVLGWLANAGVIDLHPWHSRIDAPFQPDWAVFDLDPFEPATFADVVDIARLVKAALDHYGLRGVAKTTGQTGLQIYVPIRRGPDYTRVRNWVEEVARVIGRLEPERITWEWAVARRDGKIRIDYTQNIINKTLAAPYSLRPARGAPVSTPLRWEDLDDPDLRPDRWNISTIWDRLAQVGDLFRDVLTSDQDLPGS